MGKKGLNTPPPTTSAIKASSLLLSESFLSLCSCRGENKSDDIKTAWTSSNIFPLRVWRSRRECPKNHLILGAGGERATSLFDTPSMAEYDQYTTTWETTEWTVGGGGDSYFLLLNGVSACLLKNNTYLFFFRERKFRNVEVKNTFVQKFNGWIQRNQHVFSGNIWENNLSTKQLLIL